MERFIEGVDRGQSSLFGNPTEPVVELAVHVLEITEAAAQKEVLTDVAKGALDLTRLGAVRLAGPGRSASRAVPFRNHT